MTTSAAIPNPLRQEVYSFWAMEPEGLGGVFRLMLQSAGVDMRRFDRDLTADWDRRVVRAGPFGE